MADMSGGAPRPPEPRNGWRSVGSDLMGEYRTFQVRRSLVRSADTGEVVDYFVLDLDDWVHVVPVTTDGQLVMVEQYRPGSGEVMLEFPSGVVRGGEDACGAARRELEEETGYRASSCELLARLDPNPAIQSNELNLVRASDCALEGARPQVWDDVGVRIVAESEVPELIAGGRIRHALTVATWYCYREAVRV